MTEHYDVLVVGAGPAGIAAAQAAASHGARVGLLDAQPRQGGQVWRHDVFHNAPRTAKKAMAQLQSAGVTIAWLAKHQVVGVDQQRLLVETPRTALQISWGALVLATGARELALPFPGWTLPGVTGAGGLQALAKQGWPVRGRRVVVAGSGPLLLAAAATLRQHGAHVLGIHEQAPAAAVNAFARQLWRWPSRIVQAGLLRSRLFATPYHCGSFVRRAYGDDTLVAVDINTGNTEQRVNCDLLAVGYGLVPNVELPDMLGCALDRSGTHPAVRVDSLQRTNVPNIYAVGESCGIAGMATARLEGGIAGHMSVGATVAANALRGPRRRERRFGDLLARHFVLDARLRELADCDTVICRCEDITLAAINRFSDARAAKLATRCGMGACQGRICGTALAELGRFPHRAHRPPIFPARLATLATGATHTLFPENPGDRPA